MAEALGNAANTTRKPLSETAKAAQQTTAIAAGASTTAAPGPIGIVDTFSFGNYELLWVRWSARGTARDARSGDVREYVRVE